MNVCVVNRRSIIHPAKRRWMSVQESISSPTLHMNRRHKKWMWICAPIINKWSFTLAPSVHPSSALVFRGKCWKLLRSSHHGTWTTDGRFAFCSSSLFCAETKEKRQSCRWLLRPCRIAVCGIICIFARVCYQYVATVSVCWSVPEDGGFSV